MTVHPHRLLAAPLLGLTLILVAACGSSAGSSASPAPSTADVPSAGASVDCPTSQPAPLPAGETRTVTLDTEKGAIVIGIQADLSPIAAGNFVALASCGFYDGTVFQRTATLQDGTPFVIQGGGRPDGPGYSIQDEPVTATYQRGTVAMARSDQPNSVDSQFFIVLDDGATEVLAYYNTYQIIGNVSSGMEAADAIYSASGGVEQPTDPVPIISATVTTP